MTSSFRESTVPRRRFLEFCTNALLTVLGLLVIVPGFAYFLAPLRNRLRKTKADSSFQSAGTLDSLPVGQWKLVSFETLDQDGWEKVRGRHAVWVRRESGTVNEIRVLSPICPHLGCPINWQPDRQEFLCPCHGGRFDVQGQQIAGPPPRAMDPIEFHIENGQLLVRWQDFKIGVADRVPVRD
jgi:menaquinol-cytochrome c reductase iron-sulfur subunit